MSLIYDPTLTPDSDGSFETDTWITEFCSVSGHELFSEVPEDFIEDDFNLTGLSHFVSQYREALELILDLEPEEPMQLANASIIESSAELLYGLIHARFISSRQGIMAMAQKYDFGEFGTCPRVLCNNMKLLPTGRHDIPGKETVRLYCPCCMDLYTPQSRHSNIDGAFFGTSFVGLFLKTFPAIEEDCIDTRKKHFNLTIYGFKISEFSDAGPRMKWLRKFPETSLELEELNLDNIDDDETDDKDGDDDDDDDDSIVSDAEEEEDDDDDDSEEEEEEQEQTQENSKDAQNKDSKNKDIPLREYAITDQNDNKTSITAAAAADGKKVKSTKSNNSKNPS